MLRPLWLLLAVLVLTTPPPAAAGDDRAMRLVTFNLLHGGPWSGVTGRDDHLEARLSLMVEQLRALDADVVALQESPVTRWRGDVSARLAAALGLSRVHARATERVFPWRWVGRLIVGALGFVEGPAILSRYPIVASEVYELPRCRDRIDPRLALRADVATPAGVLPVFSTHTARDDCQTRRLVELASARRSALPAVLMGDLNTVETAPALQEIVAHGFVDAFRTANPTAAGATVRQDVTASTSTARRRIDYVFVLPGTAFTADVVSSRVVLDRPRHNGDGSTLWPSDHYGVFAEVILRSRSKPRARQRAISSRQAR